MLTQSGTPGSVIDWTIFSHCIQYIDFVEIFHVYWICLLFILLVLVGVVLPLYVVATLS